MINLMFPFKLQSLKRIPRAYPHSPACLMLGNNKNFNILPQRGFSTICCKTSVKKLVMLIVEYLNNWIVELIAVSLPLTFSTAVHFKVARMLSTGILLPLVALKFHIILTRLSKSISRTPITYLSLNCFLVHYGLIRH